MYKLPNLIGTIQEIYTAYCANSRKRFESLASIQSWNVPLDGSAEAVLLNNNATHITDLIKTLNKNFAGKRTIPVLTAEITVMKSNN